jgi:hypothetical protein
MEIALLYLKHYWPSVYGFSDVASQKKWKDCVPSILLCLSGIQTVSHCRSRFVVAYLILACCLQTFRQLVPAKGGNACR